MLLSLNHLTWSVCFRNLNHSPLTLGTQIMKAGAIVSGQVWATQNPRKFVCPTTYIAGASCGLESQSSTDIFWRYFLAVLYYYNKSAQLLTSGWMWALGNHRLKRDELSSCYVNAFDGGCLRLTTSPLANARVTQQSRL